MKLAQQHNIPVGIMAPTHNLCDEHVAGSENIGHYRGRQNPNTAHEEFICYKLEETEKAGNKNHRVAQSLCTKCEHGAAGTIKEGIKLGLEDSEPVLKAIKFLKDNKKVYKDVLPCRFLFEGLPQSLARPYLASPSAAFSGAIGMHKVSQHHKMQHLPS